jgi:MoaE-MoaD fusion protein
MTDSITIRVRAFAGLREALGTGETLLEAPVGTDIAGLMALVDAAFPGARLMTRRYTVAVNRAYAPPDRVLVDGDEVGLIPPVSGGSGHGVAGAGRPRPYEITDRPISLDDVAARVAAPELGGITLFAGTVRGVTAGKNGASESFTTDYLEYEAYPEMAEASFADIAAEAQARWPEISAVAVVHRVGRQEVGDVSIAIAVAAAHRADTFDACRYIIDRIKQVSPIWKREVGPDGSSWVEGPESAV